MKNLILAISLIATVTAMSNKGPQEMQDSAQKHSARVFLGHERDYQDPGLTETKTLKVVGMSIKGFDTTSRLKINSAFNVLEKVVNSEEFKDRVINFKNTKGERAFASNKGLTNEEIYDIFMEGKETLQQDTAGEMNFFLKLYNSWWSRVIGYTSPDVNLININWKYFKTYRPSDVAGNLAHEWTHKIGFDHQSAAEHDSAPYAIGYIVDEMATAYLAGQIILH